jgi:UPF0148 protein
MVDKDDQKIQQISRMLEIGGTMLAQHCDCCGAPMFRYRGEVSCPVCKEVDDPRTSLQPKMSSAAAPVIRSADIPVTEHIVPVTEHIVPHSSSVRDNMKEPLPAATGSKDIPASQGESSALELESLLMDKMVSLAHSMQDEKDLRRISDSLDMIERGISIIEKLKRTL